MTSTTTNSKPTQADTASSDATLELHTPSSLLTSPHLPALFSLINHCFDHGHNKDGRSLLPPSDLARLQTHDQLGEEVGPDGFIFIMLQQQPSPQAGDLEKEAYQHAKEKGFISPQGNQRVIGSASAKPYKIPKEIKKLGGAAELFKRLPPSASENQNDDDTPQWEILAMVVDPALQGRGLASHFLNLTIDEIKRRCRSSSAEANVDEKDEREKKKEVMLLLSTMAILNETYYAKRGWTTTSSKSFPKGTGGSRDGFSVVDMYRRVEL